MSLTCAGVSMTVTVSLETSSPWSSADRGYQHHLEGLSGAKELKTMKLNVLL